MEMGYQLYSALSQCTGQVYSMQTELPTMIAMSEKSYLKLIKVKATQVILMKVIQ